MDRTPLLVALLIGVLLNPVTATAQRPDKTSTRTGRGVTSSKAARTPHTTSPKSATKRSNSTKTSKTTLPSATTSTVIPDRTAQVLEAMEVERVTSLEQERIQADLKKDKGWFEDSLADDLTSVTAEGLLENKAQVIARCLDPTNPVESEKYDELSVRPYGDVMIATGRVSRTGKSNNATYNIQRRFTDVWVNRTGMWQQVAIHVSSIAASDAPSQSPTPAASEPQSTNAGAASASQLAAGATQPSQVTTPAATASASPTP